MKAVYIVLRKYLVVWVALAIWLLLLVSCTTPPSTPLSSNKTTTYQLVIDLLGIKYEALINSQGKLEVSVQVTSADGRVSLSMDRGSKLLDKYGKPLQYIRVTVAPSVPLPPEGSSIVGAVYDLGPQGATVEPPLRLTLSYDSEELPKDVSESSVYIAPYDESTGWDKSYYRNVDIANHRVTTRVNHLAKFAVLVPVTPAPSQPAPKPTSGLDLASIPLAQALTSGKPTLAEFGWRTCIPCKEMKPILEELAVEYEGRLNVVIVEVYEQQELTRKYGIMAIPTQIFFDSSGKEVTRHIGLWPKKEVIAQLNKMGIK